MNDLVPFLLALRKLDANLQAEVGLDERFQHVRDLTEGDARLMVRICERHAQAGMLVALDPSDMQLPPDERAAEVLHVYRSMCASPKPSDAAQASDPERNLIALRATFPRAAFVVERAAKKRGIGVGDVTDAMLDEDGPITDAERTQLEQQGVAVLRSGKGIDVPANSDPWAVQEAIHEQPLPHRLPRLHLVHSGDGADLRRDGDEVADVTYGPEGQRIDKRPGQFCHADDDGDCTWTECPQLRDGEPAKSRRHCPLDLARLRGEDEA